MGTRFSDMEMHLAFSWTSSGGGGSHIKNTDHLMQADIHIYGGTHVHMYVFVRPFARLVYGYIVWKLLLFFIHRSCFFLYSPFCFKKQLPKLAL